MKPGSCQVPACAPRRARGFTLVELLAVVAIVGLLAAAARPLLQISAQRSQEHELRQGLRQIRSAIDRYRLAGEQGLIAVRPELGPYPPSLQALVQGVPLAARPAERMYFLRRLPRDPFADRSLPAEATWALRASSSPPERPAPGRDVFDVMSRSDRVALDGSAYRHW